ncbi:MAG: hypothetical protein ACOY3P_13420 [Planctomycetota bacterium]
MDHADQPQAGPGGCFFRLFWMLLGNVLLILCALAIFQSAARSLSVADVLYWLVVAALPAARYVDITRYGGKTSDGRPATLTDFRRYAVAVVPVALLIWLAAHRGFVFSG